LPKGFSTLHSAYDTVAIWGEALQDPDYTLMSQAGADKVAYRIPVNGWSGSARLTVRLHYQTLPPRWMRDLFTADSLPEVGAFKSMYAGYDRFTETLAETTITDIAINTVHVNQPTALRVTVYPNPSAGRELFVDLPEDLSRQGTTLRLVSLSGATILQQDVARRVALPDRMTPGVYYLQVWRNGKCLATRPVTIL
jgi:hypothetical protein